MKTSTKDFLQMIAAVSHEGEVPHKWPLTPAQIMLYFELDQAVEIYALLTNLHKKLDTASIGQLITYPNILRNFIRNAGIIGLKESNMLGKTNYSTKQKENYLEFLLEIVASLVQNDPLCMDGKNLILTPDAVQQLSHAPWIHVDAQSRPFYNGFYTSMFSYLWATYYNCFSNAGLEAHGPYPIGSGEVLVVRDFHGLDCAEVWQSAKKLPFKHLVIYQIYSGIPIDINFDNQVHSTAAMGAHLTAFLAVIDNTLVIDKAKLESIDQIVEKLTAEQTAFVNALSPYNQVKKGAEISYYSLRSVYDYVGKPWRHEQVTTANIAKFGDKWLKQFAESKPGDAASMRNLYDPRNDKM